MESSEFCDRPKRDKASAVHRRMAVPRVLGKRIDRCLLLI